MSPMRTNSYRYLLLTLCLTISQLSAQSLSTEEKIAAIPTNYFELPRENFHIQLNKSSYLSNETIWFKGFVFNNLTGKPNIATTNVYVEFYSPAGEKLLSKLLYAKNGTFDGDIPIPESFSTGTYYIRVVTNWANNFSEDESATFPVSIINSVEGQIVLSKSEPKVAFHPEGGVFLKGVKNSMGIHITDCNSNGIAVTGGKVLNSKNVEITAFQTNIHGYGKFDIPAGDDSYKLSFSHNNAIHEQALPQPQETGFAIAVNNFTNEEKTFVSLATNATTHASLTGKKVYLAIQQFDKINLVALTDIPLEKTIILPTKDLFDGINVIRIIDENLNQLNERIIFKPVNNKFGVALELASTTKDSLHIRGISTAQGVQLGISVLPDGTLSTRPAHSIINSILFHPHLSAPIPNTEEFLKSPSRKSYYDLDAILLNQTGKYNWNAMKTPPQAKFPMNQGVTLKGTINESLPDKKNYQVQMFSLQDGINEYVEIDDKNEFWFKNVIVHDSLKVNFTLVKRDGAKYRELNYYPMIINDDKAFLKPLVINKVNCSQVAAAQNTKVPVALPGVVGAVELDDVVITNDTKAKPVLVNQNRLGNAMMRGYKITDMDYKAYTNVIQFIQARGFDAGSQNGEVFIRGRTRVSITRANVPAVYLDDVQLFDFNVLDNLMMTHIDEIFINRNATSIQSNGMGVIKIYTNQNYRSQPQKTKAKSFTVHGAFAEKHSFVRPEYISFEDKGFKDFGTIMWLPKVQSATTAVDFKAPNLKQKTITLLIEGISADGKLISEIKTLTVQ